VEVSLSAHLKGPLKPIPGLQVLGTACVHLSITRWTRRTQGETMEYREIFLYVFIAIITLLVIKHNNKVLFEPWVSKMLICFYLGGKTFLLYFTKS
jgi:hypothetical protein